MKRDALRRLKALAAIEDTAARAALRCAADAEAALAAEARELDAMRRNAVSAEGLDGPRRMAGADAAWQSWLGMRRVSVLNAQARARADLYAAREAARGTFARAQAAERLEAAAVKAAQRAKVDAEARRLEALELMRRTAGVRPPGGRSR